MRTRSQHRSWIAINLPGIENFQGPLALCGRSKQDFLMHIAREREREELKKSGAKKMRKTKYKIERKVRKTERNNVRIWRE